MGGAVCLLSVQIILGSGYIFCRVCYTLNPNSWQVLFAGAAAGGALCCVQQEASTRSRHSSRPLYSLLGGGQGMPRHKVGFIVFRVYGLGF